MRILLLMLILPTGLLFDVAYTTNELMGIDYDLYK